MCSFAGENREPDNKDLGSTFPVCSVSIQAVRVTQDGGAVDSSVSLYMNLLL